MSSGRTDPESASVAELCAETNATSNGVAKSVGGLGGRFMSSGSTDPKSASVAGLCAETNVVRSMNVTNPKTKHSRIRIVIPFRYPLK